MSANIPDKYTFDGVDLSETTVNTMHTHREFMDTLSRALTAERELAELKERTQGVCHWRLTMDDWNLWEGDCGVAWDFEDDDPTVNGMEYCPKCGRKLVQLPELPEASHD